MSAHEAAIAAYRSYLEEHLDGEELGELAAMLNLELTDEDRTEGVDAMVEAMVTPGVFEEGLKQVDGYALEVLLRLLDLGDLLPTHCFLPRDTEELERTTNAFSLLRKTGLIMLSMSPESVIVLQPLARMILKDRLDEYRHAKFAAVNLDLAPRVPLRSIFALTLNVVRTHGMRITNKGDFYQRHHGKASKLFAPIDERWGAPLFDFSMVSLSRAGVVSINDDGFCVIRTDRARAVLDAPPGQFAIEFLFRNDTSSSLAISLLELMRKWRKELPGGWTSTGHLLTHGSLHDFHYYERDDQRVLRTAVELQMLGLAELSTMEGGKWFRPSPDGEALLSLLEAEDGPDALLKDSEEATAEAVAQPNLEVLLPIDAAAEAHWRVGAFAKLTSVDTLCHYEIDKTHCQAVFSRERLIFDDWIEGFARVAKHGVPENIDRTLRAWLGQQAVVELSSGTLLRLRSSDEEDGNDGSTGSETQPAEKVSDAVRNNLAEAARKLKAKRIAPDVYLIPEGTRDHKIAAALNENNLISDDLTNDTTRKWSSRPIEAESADMLKTLRRELEGIRHHRELHLDAGNFFRLSSPLAEAEDEEEEPAVDGWEVHDPPVDHGSSPAGDDRAFDPRPEEVSELLHSAVRHGKAVEILLDDIYHNASRVIVPESILRRGTQNYLTGFCLETKEHRAFNLEYVRRARFVEKDARES